MSTNYPPQPPQYRPPYPPPPPPPYPPPGAPGPRKKTSPLVWILVGIGGFLVLMVLLVVAGGFFLFHKAKQAGFDPDLMSKNPAAAAARMMVAANPDAELVSMDENRGIITVRDKKTGKTVTLNFQDIKNGRFSFEGENGEKVAIGSGAAVQLPSWLPAYPGAKPEGAFSAQGQNGSEATFGFTTSDPADKVFQFYEAALKSAGLNVTVTKGGDDGTVTAEDNDGRRSAAITITGTGSGATVQAGFKDGK